MGIFDKKNMIKIEEEDLKDAKLSTVDYADESTKKRAFIDVLGARLAIKMLFSKKIEASNIYSLYTIHSLLENIDIADIYYEGMRIDVRLVFNKNEIFIPKSHFEYDLLPHLYLVMELGNNLSSAEFLGFFEPEAIDKSNQNTEFYFYEYDKLKDPSELKSFLKRFKVPAKLDISAENFEKSQELFLSIADKDINFEDKLFLFKQLAESFELRERMVEFENFEIISNEIAKNSTIMGDGVLDIIGAQKVFEEDQKQTKEEAKAEIIGEVLTDLLDEELSEKITEEKTQEQLQSESDFLSELEPEKKANVGEEILENSVKALAMGIDAGAIIAESTVAAEAADVIMGSASLAKSVVDGLTFDTNESLKADQNEEVFDAFPEIDFSQVEEEPVYLKDLATEPNEILPETDSDNMDTEESSLIYDVDAPDLIEEIPANENNVDVEELDDFLADSNDYFENQDIEIVEDFSSTNLPDIVEIDSDEVSELYPSSEIDSVPPSQELPTLESKQQQDDNFDDEDITLTALPEIDLNENGQNDISADDSSSYVSDMSDFKEELTFEAIKGHADAFADFNMEEIPFDVGLEKSFVSESSDDVSTENKSEIKEEEIQPVPDVKETNEQQNVQNVMAQVEEKINEEPLNITSSEISSAREVKEKELARREALIQKQDNSEDGHFPMENPDYVELDVFSEKKPKKIIRNEFDSEIEALNGEIELSEQEEEFLMLALKMCEEGYNRAEAGLEPQVLESEDIIKQADALVQDFDIDEENDPLKVLFNNEQKEEFSNEEQIEDKKAFSWGSLNKNKKMVIAASIATVVIVSFAIGSVISTKHREQELANVSNLRPIELPADIQNVNADISGNSENASANIDPNAVSGADMNLSSQGLNLNSLNQPAISEDNQQLGANKDMGQAVSGAFSSEPISASITKIAWEVPEDLAYNDGFRRYLQVAGKNLKLNLQTNLLLATEMAYSNKILVDLVINQDGSLQSSNIAASSGSKQVDKIVLQSVKDTLRYLKMPASELGGNYADATLIINF